MFTAMMDTTTKLMATMKQMATAPTTLLSPTTTILTAMATLLLATTHCTATTRGFGSLNATAMLHLLTRQLPTMTVLARARETAHLVALALMVSAGATPSVEYAYAI